MTEKQYETPGGRIYYWLSRTGTESPWLVFLPGLSADHHLFDRQTAYFSGCHNCLVWDAPAHGRSRPFALEFTMEDMAVWLHGILEEEGIRSPVLIGQSLGGYVSQVYMNRYPGSAVGFVSIDSCSMSRKYYSWWELLLLKHTGWMYRSIPWKLLLKWGVQGTSETDYGRRLMERTWAVYEKKEYCALADHGFRIFAEAVESKAEYPICCPVLLICGKKDAAGSAKRYNRHWAKQDGYRLVWLKNAGHNSNTDAPKQVNRLLEEFTENLHFLKEKE